MDPNPVTIPLAWFLGSIATLCGVIVTLAVTIFRVQNERLDDERARTKEAIEALNRNTVVIEKWTEIMERSLR